MGAVGAGEMERQMFGGRILFGRRPGTTLVCWLRCRRRRRPPSSPARACGKCVKAVRHLGGIVARQKPRLPLEGTAARNDVLGGAALDEAHMDRRIRRIEAVRRIAALAHVFAMRLISPSSSPATMMALTPRWVRLECASWPVTSVAKVSGALVGVDHLHRGGLADDDRLGRCRWSLIWATSGRTPLQPTSSSQESARWIGVSRLAALNSGTMASATAIKPFMSQVPRP